MFILPAGDHDSRSPTPMVPDVATHYVAGFPLPWVSRADREMPSAMCNWTVISEDLLVISDQAIAAEQASHKMCGTSLRYMGARNALKFSIQMSCSLVA